VYRKLLDPVIFIKLSLDLAEDVCRLVCSAVPICSWPTANPMFWVDIQGKFKLVKEIWLVANYELIPQRVLRYVKGAIGETDVPDALPEFISQRRRWLNGSFFAATYAIAHVGQILRSGHSLTRKIMLMIETIYNIINLTFSWFSLVSDSPSLAFAFW